MIKILFLCGSLEPGKDGVGDYCRKIASELIRQKHTVWLLGLNDYLVNESIEEEQWDAETKVQALRLPAQMAIFEKVTIARQWIQQREPDWISLQYVPYAFHPRGLPWQWVHQFKRLNTNSRWHIMLHELWIGSIRQDSTKDKLIGLIQRQISKRIISSLQPDSITTNLPYYQTLLQETGLKASVLPVFSNMPQGNIENTFLYNQLPAEVRQNRSEWYIAAFFSAVHSYPGIDTNITNLAEKVRAENKKLLITHVGQSHTALNFTEQLKKVIFCESLVFGEQAPEAIASFFHHVDFGLSTYNTDFLGKSGSIAAMLYNNLPVILLRDTITPYHYECSYAKFVQEIPSLYAFCNQAKSWGQLYGLQNAGSFYSKVFTLNNEQHKPV